MKNLLILFISFNALVSFSACQSKHLSKAEKQETVTITKSYNDDGNLFTISLSPGNHHNHPTFAIWAEDLEGNLIQTIFVTKSIASGYYRYGDAGDGSWLKTPGPSIRPSALPNWLHKREGFDPLKPQIPTPENPFPDAMTGATPPGKFLLETRLELPQRFRLLLEVNQPWDWNNYWTNNKFPGNIDYKTSAQPSFIYAVTVDLNDGLDVYHMNPAGHGHYDGSDGLLYTDLSTLTTASQIFTNPIVNFR